MQSINTGSSTGDHTAEKLNLLISGEMAVVGMYTEALNNIDSCSCVNELATAMHCHQSRGDLLAGEVRRLGAKPYQASPAWQAFAYVVAGGTSLLDEQDTVAHLMAAEAKISEQYSKWMMDTDFGVQQLAQKLYQRQCDTQAMINDLASRLTALAA
jgi:hypothetical protein